ncbi:MAG: PAS domain-containing protein, partial [Candidatus Eremiobacteraeota bacterium]|nr:PAS domain-containing protein [Candidatus Eremiobacteraeota bacterium]
MQKWVGRLVTAAALLCIVGALALMLSINWRPTLIGVVVAALISAMFWRYVVEPAERAKQEATRKLLVSRERFRSLYDRHPDPIVTYDASGCFVRGNAAAAALVEDNGASYVGQHYSRHLSESHIGEVNRAFARALNGASGEFETVFVWGNGRKMEVFATVCPIVIDGKVTG